MRIRKLFGLGSALLLLVLALCLGGCSGGYQAADPLAGTAWIAQNDGSWWNFAVIITIPALMRRTAARLGWTFWRKA